MAVLMLLLVSGATRDVPDHDVGVLLVPGMRHSPAGRARLQPGRWAMDNGAFSGFDEPKFLRMLDVYRGVPGCLFVAAPDVPYDSHATMRAWYQWAPRIRDTGFSAALVAQDGLSVWEVPWEEVGALFVGGSTKFKLGPQAVALVAAAKRRGRWVHMGRVNTRRRIRYADSLGCDSFDGSSFSRWPRTLLPRAAAWLRDTRAQRRLF